MSIVSNISTAFFSDCNTFATPAASICAIEKLAQIPCLLSIHRGDEPLSIWPSQWCQKACECAADFITKYQKRISGTILDLIHMEIPRVDYEKRSGNRLGETSESTRARVQAAWDIQTERFAN